MKTMLYIYIYILCCPFACFFAFTAEFPSSLLFYRGIFVRQYTLQNRRHNFRNTFFFFFFVIASEESVVVCHAPRRIIHNNSVVPARARSTLEGLRVCVETAAVLHVVMTYIPVTLVMV